MNKTVEKELTPVIEGMLNSVAHLVTKKKLTIMQLHTLHPAVGAKVLYSDGEKDVPPFRWE